jgi:hypothetical protein
MTAPAQQPPPFDAGNPLLGEVPAQLTTTLMETAAGQRLALTIRTPSTTVTVLLQSGDARAWASALTRAADSMSAAGLIVAGAGALNGNGKVPHG